MVKRVSIAAVFLALLTGCSRPSPPSPGAAATAPARPSRRAPAAKLRESANVDLDRLAAETPEYEGQGRNLFAFGRGRASGAQADASPTPVAPTPPPMPVEVGPSTSAVPAAPRIDLKFAGYIERPFPDGKKVKYAIFLDGQQVLTGAEGEVVANRYRIVEIGLESVTVAPTGSNTTQRIPLKAN